MDYFREINAFYESLETNPLKPSPIALWHALMHICNKLGWPKEFTTPIKTLSVKTGMSKETIERARNKLAQCGYIRWRPRGGSACASYEIIGLWGKYDAQSAAQNDAQSAAQNDAQSAAINKPKRKPKPDTPKPPSAIPDDFSEPVRSALEDWMQYKMERNEAYKPTGLVKFYAMVKNKVAEHGEAAVAEVISLSMANNWRGIIWERMPQTSEMRNGETDDRGRVFVDGKWVAV